MDDCGATAAQNSRPQTALPGDHRRATKRRCELRTGPGCVPAVPVRPRARRPHESAATRGFERAIEDLSACEAVMTTTAAAAKPHSIVNEQTPWPGLAPLDEAAAPSFNARERLTAELFRLVTATNP